MADWRPCNPSNNVDTCLWCGAKLRLMKGMWVDDPSAPTGKSFDPDKPRAKRGDYYDGFFCGLRCAYQFAQKFAEWGKRLQPQGR